MVGRELVRDPSKVERLKGRAEIALDDLEKADTRKAAMAGVDHVFLLTVDQVTATDTVLKVTGRKPTRFVDWCRAHKNAFL